MPASKIVDVTYALCRSSHCWMRPLRSAHQWRFKFAPGFAIGLTAPSRQPKELMARCSITRSVFYAGRRHRLFASIPSTTKREWRVGDPYGTIMGGSERTRPAARYRGNRALFLLLSIRWGR
jgi:hypothetical protein